MDARVARGMESLMASPSAKEILAEFFRGRLEEHKQALVSCGPDQFQRLQGKAQECNELLNKVMNAK